MKIRAFDPSDVSELTRLFSCAYAELGAAGLNFTVVSQDDETTVRRTSGGASWVLEDQGQLLATMTISWLAEATLAALTAEASVPNRAWMNQLAVDPARRRDGLARELREVGYAWCLEQGATSIGLDTAKPATHLGALYSSWGFEAVDAVQWPGKSYESVIMTRALV